MENFADKYDWTVSLHSDIYTPESIQLAACGFLDEAFFYFFLAENGGKPGQISVAVKIRDKEKTDPDILAGRFSNELNRQSLRLALAKMNRKVRTQIVGRALASSIPVPAIEPPEETGSAKTREEDTTG